jgi:uracil-DNA glycosylase
VPFGIGYKGSSDFSRWDDDGSNYYYANCTGDHYADELPYDELGELPYELFAADAAIDIFRPFLLRQILAVNPRILVTLGRVATRALYIYQKKQRSRGRI